LDRNVTAADCALTLDDMAEIDRLTKQAWMGHDGGSFNDSPFTGRAAAQVAKNATAMIPVLKA